MVDNVLLLYCGVVFCLCCEVDRCVLCFVCMRSVLLCLLRVCFL